jgi:SAM-dependent methyltransferase
MTPTPRKAGYDRTGKTYSATRQADPRIAAKINQALGGIATVANIGAGTGSYEPAGTVIAVEPSAVMIAQRRPGAAPAVRAVAERLPIPTDGVDAALAVLTVHHWADLQRGVSEMRRIARRRVVVLTWDHTVIRQFWLLRDYLPAAAQTDADLAVPISELESLLGEVTIVPIPVPHDCTDGFGGAYWRRPDAYLDPKVQAGMSLFAMTPKIELQQGLSRLRTDLHSGRWERQYVHLLGIPQLDLGYRLLVADLR